MRRGRLWKRMAIRDSESPVFKMKSLRLQPSRLSQPSQGGVRCVSATVANVAQGAVKHAVICPCPNRETSCLRATIAFNKTTATKEFL